MNARKSGQIRRSGRATTGAPNKPKRDAAREASETISQHIKDEKAKGFKTSAAAVTVDSMTQEQLAKKQRKRSGSEKSRDGSAGRPPPSKESKLHRKSEKRRISVDMVTPETKRAREDHGWTGVGEATKRSILKPVGEIVI